MIIATAIQESIYFKEKFLYAEKVPKKVHNCILLPLNNSIQAMRIKEKKQHPIIGYSKNLRGFWLNLRSETFNDLLRLYSRDRDAYNFRRKFDRLVKSRST